MEIIPISSLSPSTVLPTDSGFKALITLLWPFSSATGQCALLLADPDARQRYQKGQVRVRFTGPSARQMATSGVGIGDSVQVALVGAQWLTESNTALVKTPGRSVDGELIFKDRLHMIVTRNGNGNELRTIDVDESTQPTSPKPSMLPPSTPVAKSRPRSSFDAYGVAVYSSPAFMKRLRLSEGGTPYSPVPVSEDDDLDIVASRKRRRVSYKNISEWKFDAREPSPEKEQDVALEDADADDQPIAEAPPTADASNTTYAKRSQDEDMGDAEPTENSGQKIQQSEIKAHSVEEIAEQPAKESAASASVAENTEGQPTVPEVNLSAQTQSFDKERPEEVEAEATSQQPAESKSQEGNAVEEEPQVPESTIVSEVQTSSSRDLPPPTLPRLDILPTESELLQRMARSMERPTTPVLQPLLTEGLPLPSPFPNSAQKIPSPAFLNGAKMNEAAKEAPTEAQGASSEQRITSNTVETTAEPSEKSINHLEQATIQKPRMIADTYESYAGEAAVILSSDSESDDEEDDAEYFDQAPAAGTSPVMTESQIYGRSRGDRFDGESSAEDESDADMESSSEDSDSDATSSVYNSEQIAALQDESDNEEIVEEPDWAFLQSKLDQEEAAIQQSREDLTARGREMFETADDTPGEEGDDAVMHDDNSEMDDDMLARSDDDSEVDSEGSGYFDRAVMPDTEENSSGESEVEMVDQSYQPSILERDMHSHPFGLDGAQASTQTRTALPSQATSAEGSVAGDETIAWRDRDAAVEALGQQAQPRFNAQVHEQPQLQYVPPPPPSRAIVVELLDDSDSEEEDEGEVRPVVPIQQAQAIPQPQIVQETISFLPSIGFVNHLLDNQEKDAHLEQTGPVTARIRSEIRKISEQASSQSTKWTKFNALKTICKIGVNVTVAADNGNMFAEGVKYRLKEDEVLVDACWKIYNELSREERYHMNQPPDMLDCLVELEEKRDYCFEGFKDFLKQFRQTYHHLAMETGEEQPIPQAAPSLPELQPQVAQEVAQEIATQPGLENNDEQPMTEEEAAGPPIEPTSANIHDNTARTASTSESESEAAEDEIEVTDVQEDHAESASEDVSEHGIDSALSQEQHEIDPALLEDQDESDSPFNEIDPALLQEEEYEHEIDPAILADGRDVDPDDQSDLMQVDDTMSEAPEPDAFSLADEEEVAPQSQHEEAASGLDVSMTDEPFVSQAEEPSIAQADEDPMKLEVQPSVEKDPDLLGPVKTDNLPAAASPASTPSPEDTQKVKDEIRPVSSSSFKTLSPSPGVTELQASEPVARSAAGKTAQIASQVLDQPIEELDLSQVEPSWISRFSQFSQSRSSRAHTRSETIPDSADEDAADLVAEGSEVSSRPASPEPMTQASPQGAQKAPNENLVQPSQELGTAFSQFSKQAHGPSGLQSQLAAIEETTPPEESEADDETRSQAGLDDELLADYVQVPSRSEAVSTPSKPPSFPSSTPRSTKKPARPLTLFRGRKSVGSQLSIGDSEQQTAYDEVMQHAPSHESAKLTAARVSKEGTTDGEEQANEEVVEGTTEGNAEGINGGTTEDDKQAQSETATSLIPESSKTVELQSQPAQIETKAIEVTESVPTSTAQKPETSAIVDQPQISSEVKQATSNFQIRPTLKPFAEVEASLFGTPAKNKAAAPREPQSAPSQIWRTTLTSKMGDVPLIGSWFTPHRTTVAQKAVTEHKATTSNTSIFEETPTKAAPAPLTKQTSHQRSISPPPLQRYASQGTSTSLSYFTPLTALYQHLNQQSSLIDIMAVCTTSTSTAERAKSGPKDYYTIFRVLDQPLGEYAAAASQGTSENEGVKDIRVEVFRPFKQSLPKALPGDVILLRGFVVRSRNHKIHLLSTASSGWCVWRYDQPTTALNYDGQTEEDDRPIWARKGDTQRITEDGIKEEITGPPVEIGQEEREKVSMVRKWWESVQKSQEKNDEPDIMMID